MTTWWVGVRRGMVLSLILGASACSNTIFDIEAADLALVGHWKLDEAGAGEMVLDASGFGNHGIPSANPPVPSPLVPPTRYANPRSLSFDGQGQLVDLGNPSTLDIVEAFTISVWANLAAADGTRNLVTHGYRLAPNQEVALRLVAGTYQFLSWEGNVHGVSTPIAAGDIGTWVFLCAVYDLTSYRIYRDGALAAVSEDSTTPPHVDAPWALGARQSSSPPGVDRPFVGLLDDVRIYDRALSREEIAALYRR